MKDFWEQLSKRIRFSIFIEFDIFSAGELKLVQFAKGYSLMNDQLKELLDWNCYLTRITFWIYNFILKCLVFTWVIFLNRINFRFTNRNMKLPFTSKKRCCDVQFSTECPVLRHTVEFRFILLNFLSSKNICNNTTAIWRVILSTISASNFCWVSIVIFRSNL